MQSVTSTFTSPTTALHKNSTVKPSMFRLCNDDSVFSEISANTPDVVIINEVNREVFILEVGCTFDHSLEEAFTTKMLKYRLLEQAISQMGYNCTLLVYIFGSLGHVHKLVVRGLQYWLLLAVVQSGEDAAICTHELYCLFGK